KMPVAMNVRSSSDPLSFRARSSTVIPISKHPATFTNSVHQGKPLPSQRPKPMLTAWRAPEPKAPPIMAQNSSFMARKRSRWGPNGFGQPAAEQPTQPPAEQQGNEIAGHEHAVFQIAHLVRAGEGELRHRQASQDRAQENRGQRRHDD